MVDERDSGGVRRSSGVRFVMTAAPSMALRYSGFVACLALLPIAIASTGMRGPVAQRVDAGAVAVTVRLPDSSRVILGQGSSLRYRRDFAQRRTLWLFGRGAVEIVSGAPFTLWTETAVAKTTGATFDVRAVGLDSTIVHVRTGSIRLRALNEDNDPAYRSVTLGPGQLGFGIKMVGARAAP
jgi:ferric-dicitrate binding protein FerR (iron transport regulator)